MKIELEVPKVCSRCGFHNFNIEGISYNKDFDYTIIKVTCMRCGNKENEINVKNHIENNPTLDITMQ